LIAAIDEGDTTSFLTGVFAGSDVIVGTEEADVLFDVEGDDTLLGRAGRDELGGGPGADRLFGDQGPDTLTGGPGDDLLAGGSGQDVFVFDPSEPEEGDDTILDFNPDRDSIQLDADDIVEATTDGDLGADATPEEIAAAMDESDLWTLGPGATGTATVTHPGGSIALAGIPADALPVDSFTGLLDAGVLAIDDGGMIA
jgi:Ca2+-binding RTX toxin-like protein